MDNRGLLATLMTCLTVVAVIFIMARCTVDTTDNCRASNGTPVGMVGPTGCIERAKQ